MSHPAATTKPEGSRTTGCRLCGSTLTDALALGDLPLGNALRRESQLGDPQPRYPLTLALCTRCGLSQLAHDLDPDAHTAQLPYYTSTSDRLLDHHRQEVEDVGKRIGRDERLVVEIGGSDGGLLRAFRDAGMRVIGVEPIRESAEYTKREYDIDTVVDFFTEKLANELRESSGRAGAIIANYVLPLVPEPNDFVAGLAALLDDDGVALLEQAYLVHMVTGTRFDGIAHVRQTWLDASILTKLLADHGLVLSEVELLRDFRGGTLRVWIRRRGHDPGPSVAAALAEERALGVGTDAFYDPFAQRVEAIRSQLPAFLRDLRSSGATVAVYGGGIKASTLINACGLGTDEIDFVVDGNPVKQGMYMPGPDLRVRSPDALIDDRPTYTLLAALDHATEVMEQQKEYRERGGRFVLPVPEPHVV